MLSLKSGYAFAVAVLTAVTATSASAASETQFAPIDLSLGTNSVPNIDGKGRNGFIDVYWRGNGNAWGYNLFLTRVDGEIAIHEADDGSYVDLFRNTPHVEEDFVTSVRFAKASYQGAERLHALVATRLFENSVPEPAKTVIRVYALVETDGSAGTTFQFEKRYDVNPKRLYCNADMALKTELNVQLPSDYSGSTKLDGCFD